MSESTEREVKVGEVAKLLTNVDMLIPKWRLLYFHLDLVTNRTTELDRLYQSNNFDSFSLILQIITQWVQEKGNQATVLCLSQILEDMRHKATAEALLDAFPKDAKISLSLRKDAGGSTSQSSTTIGEKQSGGNLQEDTLDEFEDKGLQEKTLPSGGIPIFELVPHRQPGKGRVVIFLNYLLKLLSDIGNKPVAIISINGKQRTGKSFMANQLVKCLKSQRQSPTLETGSWLDMELEGSFEFNDSHDRVTSGIQVWFEALEVEYGGETCGVIVMDTQGLHDKNTGSQENHIIFALSLLLSSTFIFNEKNAAEDSLQFLRSYLEFAKFASGSGSIADRSDGAPSQIKFQEMILLLRDYHSRDFISGYYDDNRTPPNQTRNLKAELFCTAGIHSESVDTRRGIENCFEKIGVYAMTSPGKILPDNPNFKESSKWDKDFHDEVIDFVEMVVSPEAVTNSWKKVFGNLKTAEELRPYLTTWANILQNTEGQVQSKTIFETTAKIFFNQKIDLLLRECRNELTTYLQENPTGVPENDFHSNFTKVHQNFEERFSTGASYGGPEILEMYKANFIEKMNAEKQEFISHNRQNIDQELKRLQILQEKAEVEREAAESRRQLISNAESYVEVARLDYKLAEQNQHHVITSRDTYRSLKLVKHANRVLGIKVSPSYSQEWQFDPEKYETALRIAEADVAEKRQRLANAESKLQEIKDATPNSS